MHVAETVNNRLSSYDVAFVGIFAALSVIIIKTLPGIPIAGVPGANIKFDAAIAPIYCWKHVRHIDLLFSGDFSSGRWIPDTKIPRSS
jgi:hypothetical protein